MKPDAFFRSVAIAAMLAACAVHAQSTAPSVQAVTPQQMAARLQQDVASLRGLEFKQAVPIEQQTPEAFGEFLEKEMAEVVPPAIAGHFDKIVQRLGLYRGPPLGDFSSMMRAVMTSQAAAYYDTEAKRIFILAGGDNELEQGIIYAHELHHALQDQHFDLGAYLAEERGLNADQALARQAVVEGEATYIHTLWAIQQMTNAVPPRAMVEPAIRMQADLSIDQLREMIGETTPAAAAAAEEFDSIPPFILETLVGSYLKGAAFVFAAQEQGWPAVAKLYGEYPPQSTEQILHPEKWLAREGAARISWPDLARARALSDWELLDDDVLGEFQWRIIFNVHGLQNEAAAAAAGWDGDRYAVFKRKDSSDTLLLLRTAWDNEAEAKQFVESYRRVLAVKYAGGAEPVTLEQQGAEVFIVEGGRKADHAAWTDLVRQARKSRE